ncbi:sulfurtransferase complex subunit TusD [Oceanospirillum beijerinckii]|uniref:sulfurtransferase complex subunit TusD n=1 Tax=Oceanospirillum beijerinckii TaxID=64976 RepID=UPI0004048DF6|nr:sulfurtransferase complex subunit TusD [Oceanospirillum beijerinckii]
MKYSIAVYGGPYSHQATHTAFHFAQAVLDKGHEIQRVFFYHDGIYNGSALVAPPQDEANLPQQWQQLAEKNGVELVVCIAAAVRRGLLDENEAKRYSKPGSNLEQGYQLSGLGQLVDAGLECDRLVSFGP